MNLRMIKTTFMKKQEEKMKIQFENGDVRTLRPVQPAEDSLMEYFNVRTGTNYAAIEKGYLFKHVVGDLKSWLKTHGLHHPGTTALIIAAEGIIACDESEHNEGFVAFTEEDEECLLVCPCPYDPYVLRISKMVYDEISGRQVTIKKRIVSINFLHDEKQEETIQSLTMQLSEAVDAEDYELAVAVRDKLNAMTIKN
jgi:hypothetical protein